MTAIFLSYRRADTGGYAGRLADALEQRFGPGSVFQDVETIAPGTNFVEAINTAIARCQVLVVLIGDTWTTQLDANGSRRLIDSRDYVRLEVASALRGATPVLPVLVEGAAMPAEDSLPPDLAPLTRLQALELSDSRWDFDVDRLAAALRALTGGRPPHQRRRAILLTGTGVMIAAVAAAAVYLTLGGPADVSGRWNFPNGSFWIVTQEGRKLIIEETHYQSKQVWKRGSGTVDEDRVEFVLELVFGVPLRYAGRLRLSADGSMLIGEVRDTSRGAKESLLLIRGR